MACLSGETFNEKWCMRSGVDLRCELVRGNLVMSMGAAGEVMDKVAAETIF